MMSEGFELMAVGMTAVFSFLLLLVGVMYAMAAFFQRFAHLFPEPAPEPARASGGTPLEHIAVAIVAARMRQTGKKD